MPPRPASLAIETEITLLMCGQFEQPEVRELKMILDGQNEIHRSLKKLVIKLDEVVGRQERELSLLTMISQQQMEGQPQVAPTDRQQVSNVVIIFTVQKMRFWQWRRKSEQLRCWVCTLSLSIHFTSSAVTQSPVTERTSLETCVVGARPNSEYRVDTEIF